MKSTTYYLLLLPFLQFLLSEEIVGNPTYVKIQHKGPLGVDQLSRLGMSIDQVGNDDLVGYLTQEEVQLLDKLNFKYQIMNLTYPYEENRNTHGRKRDVDVAGQAHLLADYHDYKKLTDFVGKIEQKFPTFAEKISLGKSDGKRELWTIRLTDEPGKNTMDPEVHLIGNMHGDEVVGREMLIALIDYLCSNYDSDPRVANLIKKTDLYITPSMNPDGFENKRRTNNQHKDLNRNFPDQFTSPENSLRGKQVEVQRMMNWTQQHNIVLSANLHGGSVVANYPWDGNSNHRSGQYSPAPDDLLFKHLAKVYADLNPTMRRSREFAGGITNGADWYVLYGGMQDWKYYYHGALELTLELSEIKWPSATKLIDFWKENQQSLIAYVEEVHKGVWGVVKTEPSFKDRCSLKVRDVEEGKTIEHSVYTDPENGDYHRILLPGEYEIIATCKDHYTPIPIRFNVPVNQTEALKLPDIKMTRIGK